MHKRKKEGLLLAISAIVACLSWGCSRPSHAATVDFGPSLSAAVEKARASSSSDQISSILRDTKLVTLTGTPLVAISRMAVSREDRLFVLDVFSRHVKIFSAQGEYERQLGQNGQAPGQYITPTDVKATDKGIVVDDFTVHRINEFSDDGSFVRSFVYSAQAFGSSRLGYFPKTRNYALFGNKWLAQAVPSADRSADLVNIYDHDGRYQTSTFEFPDRFLKLNLVSDDVPETYLEAETNTLYFALPFEYKVYALTSSGSTSIALDETSTSFKEPTIRCDPKAGPEGMKAFQSWLLTWTPIVAVWKNGPYLLIEYQTFDPLRYTVDIRDSKSHRLLKQLATNYRYLTTDAHGRDWFVKDLAIGAGQQDLLVGKRDDNVKY
jgi:hypothetical protein